MITFAMAHPFITLIIVYLLICLAEIMWKTCLKSLVVWKHGYPPEHCDAFGNCDDK